jgi:hypothetical protein
MPNREARPKAFGAGFST